MVLSLKFTNEVEFKRRLLGVRTDLMASRKAVRDFRPVFRKIDRRISVWVKGSFDQGWPDTPLSEHTVDHRRLGRGWYGRAPRFRSRTGRWTGTMFKGLMGRAPLGQRVFTKGTYDRIYGGTASHAGGGAAVAESFLYGRGPAGWSKSQPARPAWPKGQREQASYSLLTAYVRASIIRPLMGAKA